jgi:hypothetical protein
MTVNKLPEKFPIDVEIEIEVDRQIVRIDADMFVADQNGEIIFKAKMSAKTDQEKRIEFTLFTCEFGETIRRHAFTT